MTLSAEQQELLARRLAAAQMAVPRCEIPRRSHQDACCLSDAQRAMWFLEQIEPRSARYNIAAGIRIDGGVIPSVLEASLDDLVHRHPTLMMRIAEHDGEPKPQLDVAVRVRLERAAVASLEDADRFASVAASRPVPLTQAPLVRATLYSWSPAGHLLLLVIHHIAADGWSLGILGEDLGALYDARLLGKAPALQPLTIDCFDFNEWQRTRLVDDPCEDTLRFWRCTLANPPEALALPGDRPRPAVPTGRGGVVPVRVQDAAVVRLHALAAERRTTLGMVLLATFAAFLHRASGQDDLIVGMPVAGRRWPELERVVGLLVDTLPIRIVFAPELSFAELLANVRDAVLSSLSHQIAFDRIVRAVGGPHVTGHHMPLVQAMFTFQTGPAPMLRLAGLTTDVRVIFNGTSKLDLMLSLAEAGSGLAGSLEYNADIVDERTAARWARQYVRLLEEIGRDADQRVDAIDLPGGGYQRQAHVPRMPTANAVRRALPASRDASRAGSARTPMETLVATQCAELLGRTSVDVTDNFFTLGGHSLLATRLLARLRQRLGLDLPLRLIFEQPCIATLAAAIESYTQSAVIRALPPILRAERSRPLRLSPTQTNVWFAEELAGGATYHMAAAFLVEGFFSQSAFERSLQRLVDRHEALRITIEPTPDGPRQRFNPSAAVLVRSLQIDDVARPAVTRACEAFAAQRFDVATGPLVRAGCAALDPRRHVIVVAIHHVAADGGSVRLIVDELAKLYEEECGGPPAALPPLAMEYADISEWQLARAASPEVAAHVEYWVESLRNTETPAMLPTDRPRDPSRLGRGGIVPCGVDSELADGLRALAEREGVSLHTLMLAAFAVLVRRHAGEGRIVIGSPVDVRSRGDVEQVVGCLANTIALSFDVNGASRFVDVLADARRTVMAGLEHSEAPFGAVVERLSVSHDFALGPIVQVMLAVQAAPALPERFAGLRLHPLPLHLGAAKFDLTVTLEDRPGDLTGTFEYNTDLFDRATLEALRDRFLTLLRGIVAAPTTPVGRLPVCSTADVRSLQALCGQTAASSAAFDPLEMFERCAAAHPESPAVADSIACLSYGEIDARADVLAARLIEAGLPPCGLVGLLLDRSIKLVTAVLAAHKAGGAYVPLDPGQPPARLAAAIRRTRADVWIASEPFPSAAVSVAVPMLNAAGQHGAIPQRQPGRQSNQSHLAYIVYTSGSTGAPKGVAVTRRSLSNLVAWHVRTYSIGPQDRCTLVANVGFDASVWEMWPVLAAGASLHIPDDETRTSPARLARWIERERITVAFLPTPIAEAMLAVDPPCRGCLRYLLTGGDRLRRRPADGAPFALVNHYGPTEATVVTTAGLVPAASENGDPPIGTPIANVRVYLLDNALEPVPPGVPGEIFISGRAVALGYWDAPPLTAERFVPDPFCGEPGARMYRTGDWARLRANGQLAFCGRRDRQVKVRGVRVDISEIERALLALPGVRDAVVVAGNDHSGEQQLLAYCVSSGETQRVDAAWRAALRRTLPEWMIPAAFTQLAAIPRLTNGKVDLGSLPAPCGPRRGESPAPPSTEMERTIVELWREVLGRSDIGIHDNFFALGGHSLRAAQLTARLSARLGIDLPLRAVFETPTLAAFAKRVADARATLVDTIRPARRCSETHDLLARLDTLSDDQIERLLTRYQGSNES